MAKKKVATKKVVKKPIKKKEEELISVKTLGGYFVVYLGTATEGQVTKEQWARLSRIKINGKNYVERSD